MNRTFSRGWPSALKQVVCSSLLSSAIAGGSAWAGEPAGAEATLVPATAAPAAPATDSVDVTLTFPGSPKEEVILFLKRTLAEYQEGQKPLENLYVTGRISRATSKYVAGKQEKVPEPEWHDFTFVSKDNTRRFERGHTQWSKKGNRDFTVYRHLDDEAIYKLDDMSLALYPLDNVDRSWGNLNFDMWIFQMPYDPEHSAWCTINEFLTSTLERVDGTWGDFDSHAYVLKCLRDAKHAEVSYQRGADQDDLNRENTTGIQFSTTQVMSPVRIYHRFGSHGSGLYHTCESKIENAEVAPGVFYPKSATSLSFVAGKGPVKDGGAGWSRSDLDVQSVKFGDFECDPKLLSAKGLPIPMGANVEDRRSTPLKSYTFGRAPIEESILQEQLRPARPWFVTRVLLSVLILCGLVAACFGYRGRQPTVTR